MTAFLLVPRNDLIINTSLVKCLSPLSFREREGAGGELLKKREIITNLHFLPKFSYNIKLSLIEKFIERYSDET